jgi:4-hydroxy-tetrahydrodipicolinate reductase
MVTATEKAAATAPIDVLVSGYLGRMGATTVRTVAGQADMRLVGGYDPATSAATVTLDGRDIAPAFSDLSCALEVARPNVLVDFSLPQAVLPNLELAVAKGVDCVLGTTGVSREALAELTAAASFCPGTAVFVAPNFAVGAVLMNVACKLTAAYFEDVEIIEYHHNGKADAPSGTAIATAAAINAVRVGAGVNSRSPGAETELDGLHGARGAASGQVHIHSLRSDAFMASQQVIFGSSGQSLSIRHDTTSREAYMPGVLLAIRKVGGLSGLVFGLEELMEI